MKLIPVAVLPTKEKKHVYYLMNVGKIKRHYNEFNVLCYDEADLTAYEKTTAHKRAKHTTRRYEDAFPNAINLESLSLIRGQTLVCLNDLPKSAWDALLRNPKFARLTIYRRNGLYYYSEEEWLTLRKGKQLALYNAILEAYDKYNGTSTAKQIIKRLSKQGINVTESVVYKTIRKYRKHQ